MKSFNIRGLLVLVFLMSGIGSLVHAATVGAAAPDFLATDSNGQKHKLSDLQGKYVVLEWHNKKCPFVVSQYQGKMQKLQAKWVKQGVQWFAVVSSAPGMEGYTQANEANEDVKIHHSHVTAMLLDPEGTLGHAYGAKTTPHMFVIDPKGILIYDGAIDNAPRVDDEITKTDSGETFVNYVDRALSESMLKGKKVSIPSTPPYGCHVKYKD